MKLEYCIDTLKQSGLLTAVEGETDLETGQVSFNSREIKEGALFICKGAGFKREYLVSAIENGALAYVAEENHGVEGCTAVIVNDIRSAMPVVAKCFYGDLDRQLEMIGITGTKGKTSTAFFLKGIIDEYESARGGRPAALSSGVYNYDGVTKEESSLTTPENLDLFRNMDTAVKNGVRYMVMEVSSQALKYGRVSNVDYAVACFLNIGRDHISPIEHPDFDDYFSSKLKIFDQCRIACVNLDADHAGEIIRAAGTAGKIVTFSQKDENADVYGYNAVSDQGRVTFDIKFRESGKTAHIRMAAAGLINVENALAAATVAEQLGMGTEYIEKGLATAVVPGRMEMITSADGKRIAIVDYAHNRLSFEKLFETLRNEFPGRKFIVAAGVAGGKALQRKQDVAETVAENAEYFFITEDDWGKEPIEDICREMAEYADKKGGKYEIIYNREEAVLKALSMLDETNILIAAGKGHETTIKRGSRNEPITPDAELIRNNIDK